MEHISPNISRTSGDVISPVDSHTYFAGIRVDGKDTSAIIRCNYEYHYTVDVDGVLVLKNRLTKEEWKIETFVTDIEEAKVVLADGHFYSFIKSKDKSNTEVFISDFITKEDEIKLVTKHLSVLWGVESTVGGVLDHNGSPKVIVICRTQNKLKTFQLVNGGIELNGQSGGKRYRGKWFWHMYRNGVDDIGLICYDV